jgi:hypothetical protein
VGAGARLADPRHPPGETTGAKVTTIDQAAGGYVVYEPEADRYTLPDEHAPALADEDSPFYLLACTR